MGGLWSSQQDSNVQSRSQSQAPSKATVKSEKSKTRAQQLQPNAQTVLEAPAEETQVLLDFRSQLGLVEQPQFTEDQLPLESRTPPDPEVLLNFRSQLELAEPPHLSREQFQHKTGSPSQWQSKVQSKFQPFGTGPGMFGPDKMSRPPSTPRTLLILKCVTLVR